MTSAHVIPTSLFESSLRKRSSKTRHIWQTKYVVLLRRALVVYKSAADAAADRGRIVTPWNDIRQVELAKEGKGATDFTRVNLDMQPWSRNASHCMIANDAQEAAILLALAQRLRSYAASSCVYTSSMYEGVVKKKAAQNRHLWQTRYIVLLNSHLFYWKNAKDAHLGKGARSLEWKDIRSASRADKGQGSENGVRLDLLLDPMIGREVMSLQTPSRDDCLVLCFLIKRFSKFAAQKVDLQSAWKPVPALAMADPSLTVPRSSDISPSQINSSVGRVWRRTLGYRQSRGAVAKEDREEQRCEADDDEKPGEGWFNLPRSMQERDRGHEPIRIHFDAVLGGGSVLLHTKATATVEDLKSWALHRCTHYVGTPDLNQLDTSHFGITWRDTESGLGRRNGALSGGRVSRGVSCVSEENAAPPDGTVANVQGLPVDVDEVGRPDQTQTQEELQPVESRRPCVFPVLPGEVAVRAIPLSANNRVRELFLMQTTFQRSARDWTNQSPHANLMAEGQDTKTHGSATGFMLAVKGAVRSLSVAGMDKGNSDGRNVEEASIAMASQALGLGLPVEFKAGHLAMRWTETRKRRSLASPLATTGHSRTVSSPAQFDAPAHSELCDGTIAVTLVVLQPSRSQLAQFQFQLPTLLSRSASACVIPPPARLESTILDLGPEERKQLMSNLKSADRETKRADKEERHKRTREQRKQRKVRQKPKDDRALTRRWWHDKIITLTPQGRLLLYEWQVRALMELGSLELDVDAGCVGALDNAAGLSNYDARLRLTQSGTALLDAVSIVVPPISQSLASSDLPPSSRPHPMSRDPIHAGLHVSSTEVRFPGTGMTISFIGTKPAALVATQAVLHLIGDDWWTCLGTVCPGWTMRTGIKLFRKTLPLTLVPKSMDSDALQFGKTDFKVEIRLGTDGKGVSQKITTRRLVKRLRKMAALGDPPLLLLVTRPDNQGKEPLLQLRTSPGQLLVAAGLHVSS